MWLRHKGACLILLILLIDVFWRFFDENFKLEGTFNNLKITEIQKAILNKKLLETNSATNKTISESKFFGAINVDTGTAFKCFE
jgi:hypothetical protein